MAILEVVLGMMFIYMILSLLGTTVNELISSWRGWRGFYLEEGIKRLLKFDNDPEVFKKFTSNEFYKQLMQHKAPLRVSRAPEWMTSKNFVSILVNTLKKNESVVTKVDDLIDGLPKDNKLREVLEQFRSDGHVEIESFKARLEGWYEDVIAHSGPWYKRHLQMVTVFVGLAIAITINADSFDIYNQLAQNATARQSIGRLAEAYVANNANLPAPATPGDSLTLTEIKTEIKKLTTSEEYAQISNVLGLGWQPGDFAISPMGWIQRILGWIVTALAISLGAPFWFNALKKVLTIRSGSTQGSAAEARA